MRRYGLIVLALVFVLGCNKRIVLPSQSQSSESQNTELSNQLSKVDYAKSIAEYRTQRESKLKEPTGWLSLVGLYWLKEGINSFGAADDNNIIIPGITTETIGAYQKTGDEIFFGKVEGVEVLDENGEPYLGGPVEMDYPYTVVSHQSLYWHIILRGDRYGLRLKDTLAETRINFKGINYFEPNEKYKFNAVVEPSTDSINITNVLGETSRVPVAAYLSFDIAEQYYSLAALDEGGDSYFLIFSDESSAVETYGGGRFLYPPKPCDTCLQMTTLDFNKSQNPPCAFTAFATCPLPPKGNRLKVRMLAGERYVDPH